MPCSSARKPLMPEFSDSADAKYNSGLFDQALSEQVVCNASSAFWTIIRQLYFPEIPYSFSVFSSDILGHIYEIFIAEKHNCTKKSVFLPKNLDNWNKYITFAA